MWVLFLDLSKTFDMVAHDVLLLKLRHLGLKMSAVSWFESHISNRVQCTKVESHLSSSLRMNSSIPQGSILGPLLVTCYINDLPIFLHYSAAYLYANDTALIIKANKYQKSIIKRKMNCT